ncbi:nucleotidyltransferase family protein [Streptomyces thermolilacinus]|uniref:nucleotidyltransferase family protein n=1 Tax=Streptomyces thermolilacinus TaxID=285540 RepID=UPI000684FBF3|nr:nucleotidyltransferase family protein [Streptomyces thermolilacinus]
MRTNDTQGNRTSPPPAVGPVAGLLLAAGGGRRLGGRPKALLDHRGRPLVEHAVAALRAAGCGPVHVVLGAAAGAVRERADLAGCVVVENPEWERGMGSSLRAGLASLGSTEGGGTGATGAGAGTAGADTGAAGAGMAGADTGTADAGMAGADTGTADAVLVVLVDQPGIGAEAMARVAGAHRGRGSLAAASYGGRRGHPVLLGADRWAEVAAGAEGDQGARAYLRAHESEITLVPCGDVAEPYDIDTAADLAHLEGTG